MKREREKTRDIQQRNSNTWHMPWWACSIGQGWSVEKRDTTNPYASHSIVVGDHYV